MAVKLLRWSGLWAKFGGHPCWRVQKALEEQEVEYELVPLPRSRRKRNQIEQLSGQRRYPAIQFQNGSVYREESKDMAERIRAAKLFEGRQATG